MNNLRNPSTLSIARELSILLILLFSLCWASQGLLADDASLQDATGKRYGDKPNILWLLAEDMSTDMSCYGTKGVQTPNLDKLASEGALFLNAFTTAPVCSPARTAMYYGVHQCTFGGHQHRSRTRAPEGVSPIPHILQDTGYFTGLIASKKTDSNITPNDSRKLFQGGHRSERESGQPFYIQGTFMNTHRTWSGDPENRIDPRTVDVPPYYPDTPLVRADIARGLEEIQVMDAQVGRILDELEADGLADNTIVIFMGDNGRCQIRGKQFLYDGGVQVPLIIRWPDKIKPGTVIEDLTMHIDISAMLLNAAGVATPDYIQGRDPFDQALPKHECVYVQRDKMDNTHDAMRAVRTKDFKYILNLMPERAYCQYNGYKEAKYPLLAEMNVMHIQGELTPAQDRFMQPTKPEEELYDLHNDPHEINNLADDPAYAEIKRDLSVMLEEQRRMVNDPGVSEEFRTGGWPSTYPTRSLEQWQSIRDEWEIYLLEDGPHPNIGKRSGLGAEAE